MRFRVIIIALLAACGSAWAQIPSVNRVTTTPAGVSCTPGTSPILILSTDGGVFYCSSGTSTYTESGASTGDISAIFDCIIGDCASVTVSNGDVLSFATCTPDGTAGDCLIIPQTTDCTLATDEGQICWDTATDTLYVGTGAAANAVGGSSNCGVGNACTFDTSDTIAAAGITVAGSTSGTLVLKAAAEAGTGRVVTIPAVTGVVITDGDTATVTSAMVAANTLTAADLAADSVDSSEIAANAVGISEMGDDAVGLAEMAHGTAGNLITYGTGGAPEAVATGTLGYVLTSGGAGAVPTFQAATGGSSVEVNNGGAISNPDFTDSADIAFSDSSGTVSASYVSGSIATGDIANDTIGHVDIDFSARLDQDVGTQANEIWVGIDTSPATAGCLFFEGPTFDAHEGCLTAAPASSDKTWTLPNVTGTVSLIANTETLTNKTLTSPIISGPQLTLTIGANPTTDGRLLWNTSTNRLQVGDGAGGSYDFLDSTATWPLAATGDSATAFFSAGTCEHERGCLEADVSAYAGLVRISGGATSAVTSLAGLNTAISASIADGAHVANYVKDDEDDTIAGQLTIDNPSAAQGLIVRQDVASGGNAAIEITTSQNVDTTDYAPFRVYENNGATVLAELYSTGEFYARSFTSEPVEDPIYYLYDSGIDDPDKEAMRLYSSCTTETTALEECDLGIASTVAGTQGTLHLFYDASADLLSIGHVAAGAVTIGSSSMTALTVATNGTGTAEVALPAGSIDGTEILDGTIGSADMGTQVRSMNWDAGSWHTDGTGCANATEVQAPAASGMEIWSVKCADSDTARAYQKTFMPDGWDAGTVQFFVSAQHATSESLTCLYDVTCQCIGDGEAYSSTFTTEGATTEVSLVFTTLAEQNQFAVQSAGITCTGTCAAGDMLRWELEVDEPGSGANCANVNLTNVKMEYTSNVGD